MTKPENLHELTREALARVRMLFPEPIIDVEHRGEGDCALDAAAFVPLLTAIITHGLTGISEGESLWMRSSGTDASFVSVDVRWRGAPPVPAKWEILSASAAKAGATLEISSLDGEQRARLAFPRAG